MQWQRLQARLQGRSPPPTARVPARGAPNGASPRRCSSAWASPLTGSCSCAARRQMRVNAAEVGRRRPRTRRGPRRACGRQPPLCGCRRTADSSAAQRRRSPELPAIEWSMRDARSAGRLANGTGDRSESGSFVVDLPAKRLAPGGYEARVLGMEPRELTRSRPTALIWCADREGCRARRGALGRRWQRWPRCCVCGCGGGDVEAGPGRASTTVGAAAGAHAGRRPRRSLGRSRRGARLAPHRGRRDLERAGLSAGASAAFEIPFGRGARPSRSSSLGVDVGRHGCSPPAGDRWDRRRPARRAGREHLLRGGRGRPGPRGVRPYSSSAAGDYSSVWRRGVRRRRRTSGGSPPAPPPARGDGSLWLPRRRGPARAADLYARAWGCGSTAARALRDGGAHEARPRLGGAPASEACGGVVGPSSAPRELCVSRAGPSLHNNLGLGYSRLGDAARARRHFEVALAPPGAAVPPREQALTLNNLALLAQSSGEPWRALVLYHQAEADWRSIGDTAGQATTLHNIGSLYAVLGRLPEAADALGQALRLRRSQGNLAQEANTTMWVGWVRCLQGNFLIGASSSSARCSSSRDRRPLARGGGARTGWGSASRAAGMPQRGGTASYAARAGGAQRD